MAILPGIRGAKVEIIMNGTARREYNDRDLEEDLNEYEIERYIEAIPGQVFSVRIELLPDFMHESNCLRCRIFVDGALVDAPLLLKADADSIFISEGNELDGGMVEKYRFASPETGKWFGPSRSLTRGTNSSAVQLAMDVSTAKKPRALRSSAPSGLSASMSMLKKAPATRSTRRWPRPQLYRKKR